MLDELKGVEGFGMRRCISPVAAWALSLGCMVGWGSFVMPSSTYLPKAGPLGTAIAFVFGMLAMLVVAANYGYMAQHCPEEGGVYSYARAEFGPNQAFVCSWCLVLAYCAAMVSNATAVALVVRSMSGGILQVGPHYAVAGYDVYVGEELLGVLVMTLTACVCVRSTRLMAVVETLLVVGLVAGIGVLVLLAATSPATRTSVLSPAFSPKMPPVAGTLAVVATVPWAFIGFEAVAQVSGECSFKHDHFTKLMALAIAMGTVMYLALNTVTAALIPDSYNSWVAYLEDLPNLTDIAAIPSFQAGYHLAGRAGLTLFGVTALCAVLSGVVGFYAAASRLIYMMAVDGALGKRYSRLHERYHTPVVATGVILAVALVVPFLGRNVLTWIVDLMSLGALIAYLYTSIATLRTARRENHALMRLSGWLGIIVSCLCVGLLIIPIPQLGTSLSKESYVILLAWVAIGVNFFTPTIMRH